MWCPSGVKSGSTASQLVQKPFYNNNDDDDAQSNPSLSHNDANSKLFNRSCKQLEIPWISTVQQSPDCLKEYMLIVAKTEHFYNRLTLHLIWLHRLPWFSYIFVSRNEIFFTSVFFWPFRGTFPCRPDVNMITCYHGNLWCIVISFWVQTFFMRK